VFAWKEATPSDKLRPIKIAEKKDTATQGGYAGMGNSGPMGPSAPSSGAKGGSDSESDSSLKNLNKGGD
jgi:hypothetical protein